MRNTFKIANWEIKRNMKNKSFIIGLFLTPLIFLGFMIIPTLFSDSEPDDIQVVIKDELGVYDELLQAVEQSEFIYWDMNLTDMDEQSIIKQLESEEDIVYVPLTEKSLNEGKITIYTSESIDNQFVNQTHIIEEIVHQVQLEQLGLTTEELEVVSQGVALEMESVGEPTEENTDASFAGGENLLERIVPGAFAGIILFSIVISGMMVFQSASQEKKDKIAEIILSSVTPNELMQGKIIGYFVLGIVQVFVWLGIALPVAMWKFDFPFIEYLFVPQLGVLLFIAVLGYLLFASIFVGLGATMEDVSTSGNFQGVVLMLPFLPFLLLGPILSNPSGVVAQVGSYIPFTSPGVLIIRLSMLEEWPWVEIFIGIIVLMVSVWIFMKLAGKIFQTGILLYGKNATPKEIWRWLRA